MYVYAHAHAHAHTHTHVITSNIGIHKPEIFPNIKANSDYFHVCSWDIALRVMRIRSMPYDSPIPLPMAAHVRVVWIKCHHRSHKRKAKGKRETRRPPLEA